jgi:hypothetical protein
MLIFQYAQRLFGTTEASGEEGTKDGDVEAEIEKELKGIRRPESEPLFVSIKLDTPCGEWDHRCQLEVVAYRYLQWSSSGHDRQSSQYRLYAPSAKTSAKAHISFTSIRSRG